MKKLVVGFAALAMTAASHLAEALDMVPNPPDVYVVVKGDTLWDISSRYLQDPWLWPEIWQANPQVENPHLIYPGDVLTLVYLDGRPRIIRGTPTADGTMIQTRLPDGTVKLTPRVRVISEGDAIPTLPLDLIGAYLNEAKVVDEETLNRAGYVLAFDGDRAVGGEGDKVYVRGVNENLKAYSIFRPGPAYIDPVTEEVLGFEAVHVGEGALLREGDPATFKLMRTPQEVRKADRVLPVDNTHLSPTFFPAPAPESVEGQILSVYGGVFNIGQWDVVVLNRGEREGVRSGHVFDIWVGGRMVADEVVREREGQDTRSIWRKTADFFTGDSTHEMVQLPSEEAGQLMVFRTFEKVSLALVMKSARPIHIGDVVRSPNAVGVPK
ncbi:LysM peptidoglycan-binding domain-containing protein [Permianibacter aggregans]|uniref:LysM domain-containing protein n=1 Tax=Permianibacter aggregans TaxID=1510150 RepID=A0A4R6UL96_9GAMM|nr:LysM domain-containing protein [Permianibacter aggregans]QGX39915.1 LysM domain-containing protein [Permianibacter aggregans]TDQ46279.1 LysM domain-containing protein [Permianibacter aggregans]